MKISKEDLREEVIKLSDTVKHIKTLISDAEDLLLDENKDLKEFQKMMWEIQREMDKGEKTQFYMENDARINALEEKVKRCRRLYKIRNNPYFGSIVFNDEPFYIGLTAVKNDLLVVNLFCLLVREKLTLFGAT